MKKSNLLTKEVLGRPRMLPLRARREYDLKQKEGETDRKTETERGKNSEWVGRGKARQGQRRGEWGGGGAIM